MSFVARLLVIAGLCLAAGWGQAAVTEELLAIQRLHRSGDLGTALQRVERALTAKPDDADLRFFRAVILADSGRRDDAIEALTTLLRDHPQLAEPYNNLAVLYAGQGRLEMARQALESALRNDPAYTVAHENLGDLYVRMAQQSYQRALPPQGMAPQGLQQKLRLARELLLSPHRLRRRVTLKSGDRRSLHCCPSRP
ncbi:tetratricopeptide repeat protein [Aquabacterium sp. J223]|uniref:tetratricopeptide repeat protein n=1 Tax=Aquabacterium sp. J223 TaxID=2898431 RepID=UPI0021ADFA23|nr:tetratricopeptide repeat protein [Aquabacterium sp. J223]UUX94667.1 tetratricopeptide repeat protein [Aquabacterium sp. J223]